MKVLPVLGSYYSDVQHFSEAGLYELEAGEMVLNSLEPYKAEIVVNGRVRAVLARVPLAVKISDKTIPHLDETYVKFSATSEEVKTIDVSKYPETFRG